MTPVVAISPAGMNAPPIRNFLPITTIAQGRTLLRFSPQPEPCFSPKPTTTPNECHDKFAQVKPKSTRVPRPCRESQGDEQRDRGVRRSAAAQVEFESKV